DSRTIPELAVPQNSFDKGDGLNFSIAGASIIAKVFRDHLMVELDAMYPGYGFKSHKGYATPEHQRAIRELGPCPIHRRSFDYIRELCGGYSDRYYQLKKESANLNNTDGLTVWETAVRDASSSLDPNEQKKLQLTARRLWQRLGR